MTVRDGDDPMEPLTVVGIGLAVVAGLRATWSP